MRYGIAARTLELPQPAAAPVFLAMSASPAGRVLTVQISFLFIIPYPGEKSKSFSSIVCKKLFTGRDSVGILAVVEGFSSEIFSYYIRSAYNPSVS